MNQIFVQILCLCHFLPFPFIQTKQCSRSLESHLTVINETECLPWISTSALRIWIMKCRKYNAYKLKKKERQNEQRRSYVFCVLIFVVVVCQSLGFWLLQHQWFWSWYAYLKFSAFSAFGAPVFSFILFLVLMWN